MGYSPLPNDADTEIIVKEKSNEPKISSGNDCHYYPCVKEFLFFFKIIYRHSGNCDVVAVSKSSPLEEILKQLEIALMQISAQGPSVL